VKAKHQLPVGELKPLEILT